MHYEPFSSAQIENCELLMNGQQLPCRKPKRGDILDGFSWVSGGYEYDEKSKKFKRSGGELDIALASYGDRAWASFGFTDPATW